jgi:hypothetical protein
MTAAARASAAAGGGNGSIGPLSPVTTSGGAAGRERSQAAIGRMAGIPSGAATDQGLGGPLWPWAVLAVLLAVLVRRCRAVGVRVL